MLNEIKKTLTRTMQLPWLPQGRPGAAAGRTAPPKPEVTGGKPPFPEIQFIRLDIWKEARTDGGIFGGLAFDQRIFRQYQLSWAPAVNLDFWYRGQPISAQAGQFFMSVLTQPHVLSQTELIQLAEVLGPISDALRVFDGNHSHYLIDSAEIGPLRSKPVMSVRWEQKKQGRRFLSLFIDAAGDGRTIHELHFSTPKDQFEEHLNVAIDTFKSVQWASYAPPPLSAPGT